MNVLKLGIIIVSYGHGADVKKMISQLQKQTITGDKIVVVDNHKKQDAFQLLGNSSNAIILTSDNYGFAHACNLGAKRVLKDVEVLTFINPDVKLKTGVLDEIRRANFQKYALITPRILLPDGRVNANGNVLHTTGLSWCKDLYAPIDTNQQPIPVTAISGAFFAIGKTWWNRLGGMDEHYFMYYEDTDLSTRVNLLGGLQAVLPTALVTHDYNFIKGTHKWLYLERNRNLFMIKDWPLPVLILLFPQNVLIDSGLWIVALLQGRILLKVKSLQKTLEALPYFISARRKIQKQRRISSYKFLEQLSYEIDSGSLSSLYKSWPVNAFFRINYFLARFFLLPWR